MERGKRKEKRAIPSPSSSDLFLHCVPESSPWDSFMTANILSKGKTMPPFYLLLLHEKRRKKGKKFHQDTSIFDMSFRRG